MHEHIKDRDHYANHNASCGVNQYRQAKTENTLDNRTLFLCTIDIYANHINIDSFNQILLPVISHSGLN